MDHYQLSTRGENTISEILYVLVDFLILRCNSEQSGSDEMKIETRWTPNALKQENKSYEYNGHWCHSWIVQVKRLDRNTLLDNW